MIQRARRKRMIEKSGAKIKLGMMRHLFIVMDMSECMKLQVITRTFMIISDIEKQIHDLHDSSVKTSLSG